MLTLGRHLLVELYGCESARLDDRAAVRSALLATAELIGATVVGECFHNYAPQGVSGVVIIAESHLAVHTWPEASYAAVDFFTCGELDPRAGMRRLAQELGASEYRYKQVLRGVDADLPSSDGPIEQDEVSMATLAPRLKTPNQK